jgi:hypothetical protein
MHQGTLRSAPQVAGGGRERPPLRLWQQAALRIRTAREKALEILQFLAGFGFL